MGSGGKDDDTPLGLVALRLAAHALDGSDRVVHNLTLERRHRGETLRTPAFAHSSGRRFTQRCQFAPTTRTVAADVEHEPATCPGLLMNSQPGELLQRVEHLTVRADELVQLGAHDRHDGSVSLDVEVEIAVHVADVE